MMCLSGDAPWPPDHGRWPICILQLDWPECLKTGDIAQDAHNESLESVFSC